MILNGRQHCRVILLPFAFSQKRQAVFVPHTIRAKSEQNVSAISTDSFPHLTKFCPENKFCWTSVPCCAKTMTRTRNGAGLQSQLRHCGFSMISRSTCEGFYVSKVSSPAFITPLQQAISIFTYACGWYLQISPLSPVCGGYAAHCSNQRPCRRCRPQCA